MNEFGNRIKAQRQLLRIVNSIITTHEELCGLSEPAIERWLSSHQISKNSNISKLLKLASGKLYFLGNKSQEQITDEYKILVDEFESIANDIQKELEFMHKS